MLTLSYTFLATAGKCISEAHARIQLRHEQLRESPLGIRQNRYTPGNGDGSYARVELSIRWAWASWILLQFIACIVKLCAAQDSRIQQPCWRPELNEKVGSASVVGSDVVRPWKVRRRSWEDEDRLYAVAGNLLGFGASAGRQRPHRLPGERSAAKVSTNGQRGVQHA